MPRRLGYEVTVVKDATADYSDEMMHGALDINIQNYATAAVSANEITESDCFAIGSRKAYLTASRDA